MAPVRSTRIKRKQTFLQIYEEVLSLQIINKKSDFRSLPKKKEHNFRIKNKRTQNKEYERRTEIQ